jgi:hypothetical protein
MTWILRPQARGGNPKIDGRPEFCDVYRQILEALMLWEDGSRPKLTEDDDCGNLCFFAEEQLTSWKSEGQLAAFWSRRLVLKELEDMAKSLRTCTRRVANQRQESMRLLIESGRAGNPSTVSGAGRQETQAGNVRLIIVHLLGPAPEGRRTTPKPTLARGSHAIRSSRILNSLQIFMVCRSIGVTLVPSGDPSKQCRQDLTVPPLLKLGLLSFLIFL